MSDFKLSILIPSLEDRGACLTRMYNELYRQIQEAGLNGMIEIIPEIDDGKLSVGVKRQLLLESSDGEYVVFVDDDDDVSEDYIKEIWNALEQNPDVVGFNGYITTNGGAKELWYISKDLPYITLPKMDGTKEYLRFNNHLSPIKLEIALQIGYKDMRMGEDYDYALRLHQSGLIKTEVKIDKELYHYRYISNK